MIMSDLPQDLVDEILSRVPATSLKRLRSTCKRWNALFKDRVFTEKHFHKAPKQSLVFALKYKEPYALEESNAFLVSVSLDAPSPSIEIKVALSLMDPASSLVQKKLLSSDSWRVLDDVTLDWSFEPTCVSLEGNSYWYSSDRKDAFLISFDFRRERLRHLCLPTFQSHGRICLSVVREEKLSVLHKCYNTSKMEVWVTSKIDTEAALWTGSFTVDLHNDFDKVPFRFLIDEEKKVVVCCNVAVTVYSIDKYNAESSSVVSSTVLSWHSLIYSYVPSLVQIQQSRGKRKERN
ncbi:unnamed protein product [Brassica oleracea var. botrytis]|uniref:F-box domain-containing protein n=1 Tax=Brassica oleracea var. oleracea TaxID=109376 RepID=A0A0D3DSN7_BRAOL